LLSFDKRCFIVFATSPGGKGMVPAAWAGTV
jgi:hypothetical protein